MKANENTLYEKIANMPQLALERRAELKSKTISHWLNRRNQIIISFCRFSALLHRGQLPAIEDIKHFCQFLVDYVSAGHFEVYEQIASQCEQHGAQGLALLKKHLPQINQSTDHVLDFNDRYGNATVADWSRLEIDLSNLGESFTKRVELEDELIDTLRRFQ